MDIDSIIKFFGYCFFIIIISIIGAYFIGCIIMYANAQDTTKTSIHITDEEFTTSYEFGMSASVEPNECNTCIKYNRPSECLDACHDAIIRE